jgi:hypothetical protein
MNVADVEAVMGAMQTQEHADRMEQHGVIPDTLVILVESWAAAGRRSAAAAAERRRAV